MDYSQYVERLKVCFWDDYVRDKKTRNNMIPAYFAGLLDMRDEVEEMIDSNEPFHLISGGRLSGKSSVLQYIVLRRAMKKESNNYYVTTSKRLAKKEMSYIYEWIKVIGMEQQIVSYTGNQLKLDNGSSITVQSTETARTIPSFGTIAFDQIDFYPKDYLINVLMPLLIESKRDGTLFFTCERLTKRTDMYAQVGLGLIVEHANEVDVLMRTNQFPEERLKQIEDFLNRRK